MRSLSPRLLGVGAACAVLGAAGGAIANAGAVGQGAPAGQGARAWSGPGHGRGLGGRVVHADLVVAQPGGTFGTATLDRGVVRSVSGDRLTLAEGTVKATYRTVTLTIPAGAQVRVDRRPATLAAVRAGQRVVVFHGPRRTVVRAHAARQG